MPSPLTPAMGDSVTRLTVRLAIAAILVFGAGCSRGSRPSTAEWTPRWDEARVLVPDRAELPEVPDEELCEDVLVDLREIGPGLTPGPDEVVDEAVTSWLQAAESIFFECFNAGVGAQSVTDSYEGLDQLEAEVAAVLDTSAPAEGPSSAS